MSLTPPKRLFYIPSMSTVMYDNVVDDVKDKGYVAISHVWGDQKLYTPDNLGIRDGVNWSVPLSSPDKIPTLLEAMKHYRMRYMWLDVLCMPQDKQDEINKEVSLMGDYYSGAEMTFVLTDERSHAKQALIYGAKIFRPLRTISTPIAKLAADFETILMDADKETWITRKWTFQEAVLSRNIKLVANGCHVDYSKFLDSLIQSSAISNFLSNENANSLDLAYAIKDHRQSKFSMGKALYVSRLRQCVRPEDKFYGLLGVLGYKNFPVKYGIDMQELNLNIIKYACTLGDMSWLALDSDGTGFIRQLYGEIMHVGNLWKREDPKTYDVVFGDSVLRMNACTIATVTECKAIVYSEDGSEENSKDKHVYVFNKLRQFGFSDVSAARVLFGYREVANEMVQAAIKAISEMSNNTDNTAVNAKHVALLLMSGLTPFESKRVVAVRMFDEELKERGTICQATHIQKNEKLALIVYGKCEIGNKVVALPIYDDFDRGLAIVVDDSFQRKGICLYPRALEMPGFTRHEFPL